VDIASEVVRRDSASLEDRRLCHGIAHSEAGEPLDEVLFVAMRGPRSFTGEDVAELHGHGGAINMGRLLRAVVAAGARHAEPGEFTRRAFANGRIDLTRAEAIVDIIEASSERALRLAQARLRGSLGETITELRDEVTAMLAEVEASIDFPEEGIEPSLGAAIADRASTVEKRCRDLARSYAVGRALRDGMLVAITGPVNAGKSSIFNALAGQERAIVAAEPGTTRDFVELRVVWDGVPITLIDTAGDRETESALEQKGIELGRERTSEADVELRLYPADGDLSAAAQGDRVLAVVSKGDLLDAASIADNLIVTSALTGDGLDELRARVVGHVGARASEADDGAVVSSERQRTGLLAAADALSRMGEAVGAQRPPELWAADLHEAQKSLAEVLGIEVGDEVLDALFARFCIGK
jgi:tRNA modification GTPase